MKLKKGDKVIITAGKDKGKTGKILQVFSSGNKASVEGLNLLIKHLRPRRQGEKGQRIEFPAPMDMSNMALLCPKCGKAARTGYQYVEVGGEEGKKKKRKKFRICKKCNQTID